MIYLDTHVVAWLYASGPSALSQASADLIGAADDVRVSPMVRLELQYLFELGRVAEPAATVMDALSGAIGLTVCAAPFTSVTHEAEGLAWTRDPFDRLIVAQASLHKAPLVTKDATIHANYAHAVW
ncbi:MAG TPA: PIN domain-containing protein [Longimicrobiales bacterium]|nr:PIN domain-containing protein [Longimicrobiales bacterium]